MCSLVERYLDVMICRPLFVCVTQLSLVRALFCSLSEGRCFLRGMCYHLQRPPFGGFPLNSPKPPSDSFTSMFADSFSWFLDDKQLDTISCLALFMVV